MEQGNTALITTEAQPTFLLSPTNLQEALEMARLLSDSDMVPNAFKGKPGNILVAVQHGVEIGLSPMAALSSIANINGKPGLYGDAGKALLLRAGCQIEEDDIEVIKKTNCGRCKITRPDGRVTERTYTVEDAEKAGLWKKLGPWTQYPHRMLSWRAFWYAARDGASDILKGMKGVEELRDIPPEPEKNMGAADEVRPSASEIIQGRKPEPSKPTAPKLDAVLQQIKEAKTAADMESVAAQCTLIASEEDKKIARKAYSDRTKELKAAAEKSRGGRTYAEVADVINKAETPEALEAAKDLIKDVPDDGQKADLHADAKRREKEINSPV